MHVGKVSPTLKDIAREAGVSIATVSRVVNGGYLVSPEVSERVQEAIKLLGYRPNAIARSLKGKRTYALGVVFADVSNPYFTIMAKSIEEAVRDRGYNVFLCSTDEDPRRELRYLEMLHDKQVDGLILSTTGKNDDYIRHLSARMPVVMVSGKCAHLGMDTVNIDGRYGAYLLGKHLLQKGHRRIAFIVGDLACTPGDFRFQGYREALAEADLPFQEELLFTGGRSGQLAGAVTRRILAMPDPPTAIFAANTPIAKAVLMALNEAGSRIPEDISLVSFGLDEFRTLFHPPITCVLLRPDMVGVKAGEVLLQRLEEPSTKRVEVILTPELFVGGSVKDITAD